jgi:FkbM family methyltransferase
MEAECRLIKLVDVGALGGIQDKWKPHIHTIWPIMFEPGHAAAVQVRQAARAFERSTVIEGALANIDGKLPLYITRNPTCISLLQPNDQLLQHYGLRVHFEVVDQIVVSCARYDTLFAAGEVPQPDVLKLDTQGFEYQVLLGFGGLLRSCIGVELEAHLYPLYREQRLLHDVVSLLETFGLVLSRLSPKTTGFDGNVVEVNAFFTRRKRDIQAFDTIKRAKYELLANVWNLP